MLPNRSVAGRGAKAKSRLRTPLAACLGGDFALAGCFWTPASRHPLQASSSHRGRSTLWRCPEASRERAQPALRGRRCLNPAARLPPVGHPDRVENAREYKGGLGGGDGAGSLVRLYPRRRALSAPPSVMVGLVSTIHVFALLRAAPKTWISATRASTGC